jgi:hypothetical protein
MIDPVMISFCPGKWAFLPYILKQDFEDKPELRIAAKKIRGLCPDQPFPIAAGTYLA